MARGADDAKTWLGKGSRAAEANQSDEAVRALNEALRLDPQLATAYYLRGRELFRLGKTEAAVADFDRYVELVPARAPQQWERGIALYYAGKFAEGARQFELYQTFDQNDVENAVWRFLCAAQADGFEKARKSLLPIERDVRVPLMDVYSLYRGTGTPEQVLEAIRTGAPAGPDLAAREFYGHLYLGLFYEVQGNKEKAREYVRSAARAEFKDSPRINRYMWDVARLHAARYAEGATGCGADEPLPLDQWLTRTLLEPAQTMRETEAFVEPRVAKLAPPRDRAEWERRAAEMRRETLDRVIYRGQAAQWKDRPNQVEWLGSIDAGAGYSIKKLRYEAVPGMWIPALLYVPDSLPAKTPVVLNVNGHDPLGKAAPYKQARCINLAKRGVLALNVEWLGMGQLRLDGNSHGRLNQLDLCGTSGMAPFYESMRRGIDILLEQPHADPTRVAVAGLSGGGWQSIIISALDTRVTLSNPVAGYSSFVTRIHHHSDLGDSEQTPVDLGAVADYAHLTAMLAPRAALLTYNVRDDCCFASAHALPPLLEAAAPVYALFGLPHRFRSHVNHVPGTHNFERDNREAFYRMIADQFYESGPFSVDDLDVQSELKTPEQLQVELPANNASLHQLALDLSRDLPRDASLPQDAGRMAEWRDEMRKQLNRIVPARIGEVQATEVQAYRQGDVTAIAWRLKVDGHWNVPALEVSRGEPRGTVVLLHDEGRKAGRPQIEAWLSEGRRVVAIDPFYFGESAITERGYLFPLLISTVGERPLGVQAGQVAAVAGWLRSRSSEKHAVTLHAVGERTSTIALIAAALADDSISNVRCERALGSWKEILERNDSFEKAPEQFCFGLLEHFDVKQLVALIAPREVTFPGGGPRLQSEMSELEGWYERLGKKFRPVP